MPQYLQRPPARASTRLTTSARKLIVEAFAPARVLNRFGRGPVPDLDPDHELGFGGLPFLVAERIGEGDAADLDFRDLHGDLSHLLPLAHRRPVRAAVGRFDPNAPQRQEQRAQEKAAHDPALVRVSEWGASRPARGDLPV